VVRRYDIDAVHFDDYFYPYPVPGKEFPDYSSYRQYGHGMAKDDWRRWNVDTIIQMVSKMIKEEKPWVNSVSVLSAFGAAGTAILKVLTPEAASPTTTIFMRMY
jgi:uncharacterized lipoprotein YddW (UPF0748 family)